jgi:hypothetical protein
MLTVDDFTLGRSEEAMGVHVVSSEVYPVHADA